MRWARGATWKSPRDAGDGLRPSASIARLAEESYEWDAETGNCIVVTAYKPEVDRWEPGFREGRKT
jgi:hypothetical protein